MESALEIIRTEANNIQDCLWEIATSDYGLQRNDETVERIHYTIALILSNRLQEFSLNTLEIEATAGIQFRPVEILLATGFMIAAWAEREDNLKDAIGLVGAAGHALGAIAAMRGLDQFSTEKIRQETLSSLGKKAAIARHAENRDIAHRIEQWYEMHHAQFKSLDKAAEAAIKIEPVSFRTAYKHISATAKKLRSARKE